MLRTCEHSKEAKEKTGIHIDVHLSVEITQDLVELTKIAILNKTLLVLHLK